MMGILHHETGSEDYLIEIDDWEEDERTEVGDLPTLDPPPRLPPGRQSFRRSEVPARDSSPKPAKKGDLHHATRVVFAAGIAAVAAGFAAGLVTGLFVGITIAP
jgi:hypothetical protein